MALESLKAKLSSLPGSSPAAKPSKPGLSFSLPSSFNTQMAQSTPSVVAPEQGTIGQIKTGLKLLNPLQKMESRPMFARADQTTQMYGGPIVVGAHALVARSIEAIPSIALTTIANFRKIGQVAGGDKTSEGRVNIPFDASRLALSEAPGQNFVQDSGSKMVANFDKYETAHPGRTGVNIALASLSPIIDALDAVATGEILTSLAKYGLKSTNYSPELEKALQQYGLKGLSGEEFATEFTKKFNDKAQRLILKEDHAALDELGRATNVIVSNMTGRGIPSLSRLGQLVQDVSRIGLQDAKYGFALKNPLSAEIAPKTTAQGLPGYVVEPGQAPAMGMSTRRVRRVGGAEDESGPYFRSKSGDFEPVTEKNVMPAPIRDDLDTFVTKDDDGYSIIEGQTGQQIGETQKTMAEAISAAKTALSAMPEGQLEKMLSDAPLSPRYEQVPDEGPSPRALARQASTQKPTTPEAAAATYYEQKIKPEIDQGKAFVVGADDLKDFFGKDFDDANHPTYSKAAFQLYERALKENAEDLVVFTGGGPGSGKTEILSRTLTGPGNFKGVLYDSNMSNKEGVMKQIQMARDAGKRVEIFGVIPDLGSTRVHTILREQKTGRGISDKTFARGHAGFPKVIRELLEEGFLTPEEVFLLDTRGINTIEGAIDKVMSGDFITNPLAVVKKLRYNEEELAKKYARENYKKDSITKKRVQDSSVREGTDQPSSQDRSDKGEANGRQDRRGVEGGTKKAPRVNKKLEERVAAARSFDDFYQRSGVTMESLDATARRKGYENAQEYYDAQKALTGNTVSALPSEEDSLQLMASEAGESDFAVRTSAREEIRIEDNLKGIFAALKGVDVGDLKTTFSEEQLDQARMQYEFMSEALADHPGRALIKFVSKKEGDFLDLKDPLTAKTPKERARLEDRNKKVMRAAESAFQSTRWADVYDDPDVIREAIADYTQKRDALRDVQEQVSKISKSITLARQAGTFLDKSKKKLATKTLKQTTALNNLFAAAERSGYRRGLKEGKKKYDILVGNLRERRVKLASLQEVYDLSDAEFAKIRGLKDPRFLTKQEFDQYITGLETAIQKIIARRQERVIIDALIKEGDLKKVDNLRKALQMPKLENMNLAQLKEFGDILAKTAPGDTFLGPRMIQTAKNTELGDIKTMAQGREAVAKKLGIDPKEVTETADADVFLDAFLRDPAWAERDPLRKTIVMDWIAGDIQRINKLKDIRREVEKLAQASRKSRRKAGGVLGTFREKLLSRFAKTDDMVAKYMETLPDNLPAIEKKMTSEEIAFGKFGRELMQKYHQYAVDDGAQRWTLAGIRNTRFKDMYLPHMGPKFFERWKDNGFVKAVKTLFSAVQDTKVDFNAFGDRGEVLGFEKFFKNAQKREIEEGAEYSKNVAAVLLRYSDAFEKKILLDSQIPKIKLLEQLLGRKYRTPKTITNPEGTEKVSSSLTRVLNEWINNKKGQRIETLRIKQGSQVEKYLQSANILISLMDLGGNLVTQTASGVGGELFNVLTYARGGGGAKGWVKGHRRAMTKQGRKIARENPGVIEEAPWATLADSFNEAGQTLMSGMFYLFADLAYRARRQLFLGQLTKEEFKTGNITAKRLAEIKLTIGKVHALPEFRSVQGSTAPLQLFNKYMEWAIPNFQTSAGILTKMLKDAKKAKAKGGTEGMKDFLKSRAYRDAAMTAMVGIGAYALGHIIWSGDEKAGTPLEKWRQKVAREMAGVIQSATGIGVFGSSRAMDMLEQLQNLVKLAITLERYEKDGKGYEEGDLKFPNAAERLLIPGGIKNLLPEEPADIPSSSSGSGRRGNRQRRGSSGRSTRSSRKKRTTRSGR